MALIVKRPETRVKFCLDGDLKAAHEAAEAEYLATRSRAVADDRLNDPAKGLAQKVVDLEAEMAAATVSFLVRGLPRGKWSDMVAEHAPRPENATDKAYGFNVETLMVKALPISIIGAESAAGEPLDFDAVKEWDALADDMTNSQYEDFVLAVLRVNAGRNDVPFSLSAFRMIQDSERK